MNEAITNQKKNNNNNNKAPISSGIEYKKKYTKNLLKI
jgi:hypothetical protein